MLKPYLYGDGWAVRLRDRFLQSTTAIVDNPVTNLPKILQAMNGKDIVDAVILYEKTEIEQELETAYETEVQAIGKQDHLLEKTNELSQIILNRPEGDGKYFAATVEEVAALKKLYELLKFEL